MLSETAFPQKAQAQPLEGQNAMDNFLTLANRTVVTVTKRKNQIEPGPVCCDSWSGPVLGLGLLVPFQLRIFYDSSKRN